MARESFEATFAAGLGIVGCIIGVCAMILAMKDDGPPPILIYDSAAINAQAQPYIDAGQSPMAVIDEAISRAVEAGAIVIDTASAKGPASANLQLQMFVDIGGPVGRIGEPETPAAAKEFAPEGITPMSAELIAAQHARQSDNPKDQ